MEFGGDFSRRFEKRRFRRIYGDVIFVWFYYVCCYFVCGGVVKLFGGEVWY